MRWVELHSVRLVDCEKKPGIGMPPRDFQIIGASLQHAGSKSVVALLVVLE